MKVKWLNNDTEELGKLLLDLWTLGVIPDGALSAAEEKLSSFKWMEENT